MGKDGTEGKREVKGLGAERGKRARRVKYICTEALGSMNDDVRLADDWLIESTRSSHRTVAPIVRAARIASHA